MTISAFPSPWQDRFRDLPVLQGRKYEITDDDREFDSDMAYFRDLLEAIVAQAARGGHRSPWPGDLSYDFAWLQQQVNDV